MDGVGRVHYQSQDWSNLTSVSLLVHEQLEAKERIAEYHDRMQQYIVKVKATIQHVIQYQCCDRPK